MTESTPSPPTPTRAFWEAADLVQSGEDATDAAARRRVGTDAAAFDHAYYALNRLQAEVPSHEIDVLLEGDRIGRYRIERMLGRGGMGVVYAAEDSSDGRRVAIKLLGPGLLGDATAIARFQREAEIASRLNHVNIVSVYGAGQAADRLFFVMELIDGESLADRLEATDALPDDAAIRATCRRFAEIAGALQHAHEAGVVHRDVKPSNILIDPSERLRITDFGIARPTGAESLTTTAALVGTPLYMAPEQVEGDAEAIGPATDIYSLGATLYRAVTGAAPTADPTSYAALFHAIVNRPAPPARRANASVPRALEEVLTRCLAKKPLDRYASMQDLGRDLTRIAGGRGTFGPSLSGRWRIVLAAIVVGAVVALAALFWWMDGRTLAHRDAQRNATYRTEIAEARLAYEARNKALLEASLERCPSDLRGFEWHYLHRLSDLGETVADVPPGVFQATADGKRLIVGNLSGSLQVFAADPWRSIGEAVGHRDRIRCLDVTADGRLAASGGRDGTVRIWRLTDVTAIATLTPHRGRVSGVRFLSNESIATCARSRDVSLWTGRNFEKRWRLRGHQRAVNGLASLDDGAFLVSVGDDGAAIVWNIEEARAEQTIAVTSGALLDVAVDDTSSWIAAHAEGGMIHVWHRERDVRHRFTTGPGAVVGLAFEKSGRLVASTKTGTFAWDVDTGREVASWLGDAGPIVRLRDTSWSGRGRIKRWPFGYSPDPHFTEGARTRAVGVSADGTRLITGGEDGIARIWDVASAKVLHRLRGHGAGASWRITAGTFLRDGRPITAGADSTIRVWDLDTGESAAVLTGHSGPVAALAVADDGELIASGGHEDRTVRVWSLERRTSIATLTGHTASVSSVAVAPGSDLAASAGTDKAILIWSLSRKTAVRRIDVDAVPTRVRFLDEDRLVAGFGDATVRIFDVSGDQPPRIGRGHRSLVHGLAVSPCGKRIATGDYESQLIVWDTASLRPVYSRQFAASRPRRYHHGLPDLCFSPDGSWLAVALNGGSVRILGTDIPGRPDTARR